MWRSCTRIGELFPLMKRSSRVSTAVTILVALSFSLLFSQDGGETEKTYEGFFRGESCSATTRWVSRGGVVEVTGSVTTVSGTVVRISGEEIVPGSLELFVENEPTKHSLSQSGVAGKTNWVGDLLSLIETGSTAVMPSGTGAAPPSTGMGTAPSPPPSLPSTGTTPPATGTGLPPLPAMPSTGTTPPATGTGLPPLPALPGAGTTPATSGTGLPPLPALPSPGGAPAVPGTGLPPLPTMPSPGGATSPTSNPGLPPIGTPAGGRPAMPQEAVELYLDPEVWPVGKWPEGMTHDGNHLWVAESGQRTLAQINESSGAIIERVSSGRLPVGMATNPATGEVFAEVATDQTIIKFSRAAEGGKFVSLPDYPEGISADGTAVWVLVYIDGSNESGQVIRYDQQTLAMTKSELIGFGICEMAKKSEWVWVSQTVEDSTLLHLLDPTSLQQQQSISVAGYLPSIAASENSVILAGGEWEADGMVARIDAFQKQERARRTFPGEYIYRVAADNEFVVAAGVRGTLWVMAAEDLTLLRTIHLNWGEYQPSSLMIDNETLYISTHVGNGENGSILVVKDWAPEMGHP